ncbi:MAG: hypothetical protein JNK60_07045, partial [Acidobacteria bacterium]|nr:hypothetical protein [Acidobacteriota bacterium]
MPRTRSRAPRRLLFAGELVLWVLGGALLVLAVAPSVRARSYAARQSVFLERPGASPLSRVIAPIDPAGPDPLFLGRIEIPRVGVSAMVREGVDDAT